MSASVMVSGLQEIDTIVAHQIDEAMLLGEPTRPRSRGKIFEGFWFADSGKGIL